ncbi:hypothetical protein FGG08_004994 [Glutinoglossum americanum]|uniref:EH domain-containing protein n=1 Tax=Glutinoglossum americanum TaxID=1670608 RepID=A0A9P8L3B4_9PEZI|nr:hypothetical protein FGG08_004994 [Glutinoglossum americanum]
MASLKGASHAFVKVPVKPGPKTNTYSGTNGAMAAATIVGTRGNSPTKNKPPVQSTGNRGGAGPGDAPLSAAKQSFARDQVVRDLAKSNSSNSLRLPEESSGSSTSPSNIAATLAAARFTPQNTGNTSLRPSRSPIRISPKPMNTEDRPNILPAASSVRVAKQHFIQLDQRSGGNSILVPGAASTVNKDLADATSIAPSTSLTGLFEHKQSNADPSKDNGRSLKPTSAAPIIQAPRPVRPPRSTPLTAAILATQKSMPSKKGSEVPRPHVAEIFYRPIIVHARSNQQDTPPMSPPSIAQSTNAKATASSEKDLVLGSPENILKLPAGTTPLRLGTREAPQRSMPLKKAREVNAPPAGSRASPAPETESDGSSSLSSYVSAPNMREKPAVPLPRRKGLKHTNARTASPLPPQSLGKIPLITAQERTKPPEEYPKVHPMTQLHSGTSFQLDGLPASSSGGRLVRPPAQQITPHLTGESFSNAVTASSLASSRAPSPSKSPAPPPLPKRHRHLLHHHHRTSRTPSPTRGMRHTMRKPPKPDDESQGDSVTLRGGRRNLIKKAPNKHHEGDRRRWRDEITDRERRRYEGVWAANKGLHIPIPEIEYQSLESSAERDWKENVLNLVVRDIWSRSRLGETALEEIWALVDGRGIGRLTREEFVVGMWLIDQRLKGRKLPVKVSASVWSSVRKLGDVLKYEI